MVLSLPAQVGVYLACEATDMRKAFDGLCAIVQHRFHRDPFAGDVFAFLNRRRNYAKLLMWDGNGFWLFAKRLEKGAFEGWQLSGDRTHVRIDRAQLMMLLDGIPLKQTKFRRRFAHSLRIGQRRGQQEDTGRHRESQ
jgi:transposase